MNDLKPLICTECGGHIDRATMTCKFCGIQYKLDEYEHPIRIMEYSTRVDTISSRVTIPRYLIEGVGAEKAMEMTLHKMAEQMAEKIMPLIEFTHEYDPVHQDHITYGVLRVANPHTTTGGYKEVRW